MKEVRQEDARVEMSAATDLGSLVLGVLLLVRGGEGVGESSRWHPPRRPDVNVDARLLVQFPLRCLDQRLLALDAALGCAQRRVSHEERRERNVTQRTELPRVLLPVLLEQEIQGPVRLPLETLDIARLVRLCFARRKVGRTLDVRSRHLERLHLVEIPAFVLLGDPLLKVEKRLLRLRALLEKPFLRNARWLCESAVNPPLVGVVRAFERRERGQDERRS